MKGCLVHAIHMYMMGLEMLEVKGSTKNKNTELHVKNYGHFHDVVATST